MPPQKTAFHARALLFGLLLLVSGCYSPSTPTPHENQAEKPPETRILFIGNSFTFWRGGLWKHISRLSEAMEPSLRYKAERVVRGGARPILFMAWDYDRLSWLSMAKIEAAHLEMSKKLKVDVAPVGLAWKESARRREDLDLYARDREHPSAAGMYLTLLTIEGVISGADPERAFHMR